MVDNLIVESLKISIGKTIVFWNKLGMRFEGEVIDVSDGYLKFLDDRKHYTRLFQLEDIKEMELR